MQFPVVGMSCQSCAEKIETAIRTLPGAKNVSVNFALKQLNVEGLNKEVVTEKLRSIGYDVLNQNLSQFQIASVRELNIKEKAQAQKEFLMAAAAGIPLLVFTMFPLGITLGTPVQALMAGFVVFIPGFGIHRRAWNHLLNRTLSMDTLVSVGSLAAYIQSILFWVRGSHTHGFESASTIILFISFGKFLEAYSRRATYSASEELFKLIESPIRVFRNGEERLLPGTDLLPQDRLHLLPGDRLPVDAEVIEGATSVDLSSLTGESKPIKAVIGTRLLAGAIIIDSAITLIATKSPQESFLGRLIKELETAQSKRVPLQRFADQVTSFFVPAVFLLAAGAAIYQFSQTGAPEFALNTMLSVLLVACPCALGLAVPTALVSALGAAAKSGILFRDPTTLEAAGRLKVLYFDKTGTLTEGRPQLITIKAEEGFDEKEILRLAACLETDSLHPLARAIRDAAFKKGIYRLRSPQSSTVIPGEGVQGIVDNHQVLIKKTEVELIGELEMDSFGTSSTIFIDNKKAAVLTFIDAPRVEAKSVLEFLKSEGIKTGLLTGDNSSSLRTLGDISKLLDESHSELHPHQKVEYIKKAKSLNPPVGYIGDGINDVLALQESDVGFAMVSGTSSALAAGHVSLTGGIKDLPLAIRMAKMTLTTLKMNLAWAFGYNLIMLPMAFNGLLSPIWASAAMAASSVSVVLGSVFLGWRLRQLGGIN
ncbi:MAG: cadmium-translocating P-type ATPase [Oligoflexia bacterium]|nr:cadmium-translocating P-type ATPase [Oligoflexia bacterium]